MPIRERLSDFGSYEVARRFVDRAILSDDSLFTPGRSVWRSDVLNDFHDRFVVHADEGDAPFFEKLQGQLAGADDATIQLAAELLYVHYLAPSGMNVSTKVEHVRDLLRLMREPVDLGDELVRALEGGVAHFGALHSHRYHLIRFLFESVTSLRDLPTDERARILDDPWALKDALVGVGSRRTRAQLEALLHLLHPETFESIISLPAKEAIARTWEDLVEDPEDDLDRRILQIRAALDGDYGQGFSFYEPRIRAIWQSKDEPWDQFVSWARRFYEWDGFEATEREYKLELSDALQEVASRVRGGQEWIDRLGSALQVNLVTWRDRSNFLEWCQEDPDRAADLLLELWDGEASLVDRIDRFEGEVVESLGLVRVRFTSVLLVALGAERHPPYAQTAFEDAFRLTGHPPPNDDASPGERYRHAIAFLDRFIEQAAERDLELRDRLDGQGLVWCITKWDEESPYIEDWDEETWRAFEAYRRGEAVKDADREEGGEEGAVDPLARLAEELLLDRSFLARIKRLLEQKGQVIFYGPPGTGKTYVARELAEVLTEDPSRVKLVQFHPSYAYEDFVEGYRPSKDAGRSGFELEPGPLREIADQARSDPDFPHVLIIDEINRGNVAKVLGELYFLLEYRDEAIDLQYSGQGFRLPANLWIIGTMNTADRSIALMDAALRRRFYFVRFFPQEPPIEGLLGRWLDRNAGEELRWVADLLDAANDRLDDPHFAIGPSYFLREDLTEEWVRTVWEHAVIPYLEERFFGDQEALDQFRLDRLKRSLQGVPEEEATDDDSEEQEPGERPEE